MNLVRGIAAAFIVLALCGTVVAQDAPFPQEGKHVEITVLFPAGTSADVTARLLADGMAKNLAANIVVVNRPGAGGRLVIAMWPRKSQMVMRWFGIPIRSRPRFIPGR